MQVHLMCDNEHRYEFPDMHHSVREHHAPEPRWTRLTPEVFLACDNTTIHFEARSLAEARWLLRAAREHVEAWERWLNRVHEQALGENAEREKPAQPLTVAGGVADGAPGA